MLNKLEALVRAAGSLITDSSDSAIHDKEGHFNYVTDRDVEVQEFLREGLLQILPGSLFFSEEQENQSLTDTPTWIVDPIDGTVNFTRGRSFSAVSVALTVDRKPRIALVYDPYSREMFTAQAGLGARLNGEPIRVSGKPFDRALITFGTAPYHPQLSKVSLQAALAMLHEAGDLRRTGSAALDLAWTACGRTDFFFEMHLSPWDYAAGALLVTEAGGRIAVPGPGGSDIDFGRPCALVASNQPCFEKGLAILNRAIKGELTL